MNVKFQRRPFDSTGGVGCDRKGLRMILCHCTSTSDATVRRIIAEGADCLSDVVRRCGAGRSCQPCQDEIRRLLAEGASLRHSEGSRPAAPPA